MNEKLRYEVTVDGVQESNRELNTMGGSFEDVAKKAAVFATAIIGITKGFSLASESANAFFQQQASENMVAQALKTTGNVAGVTTEQLKKAAAQLQELSNFDGDDILADVSNSLLTFKNIAGDTFMRTQQIVVDMAAKFGSLQNSAMQVGFALNDPIEGLTRLRRTGIQFTDDQQNLIKSLTETGRVAEAQAIVLSELETQFGGLAQATINPFTQMENAIGDMKESIGQAFAPMFKNFAMLANYLKDNEGLMRMFGNSLKIALGIGVGLVVAFTLKLKTLATVLATVKGLAGDWLSLLIGASAGIATTVALSADFTKQQDELNKSLATGEEEATKLLNTTRILLGENSKTVEENKSLAVAVKTLADKYNILIPLEGDRAEALKKINDELNKQAEIQPVDPSKVIVDQISGLERMLANAEALVGKYKDKDLYDITNAEKIKGWFQGYSPSQQLTEAGKVFMNNKKAVEDYNLKIAELRAQLIELENASNNVTVDVVPKDLSALETYYNTVKFADSSYFDFKTALNVKEADEYQKLLISKGYSEQEALSFRNKYYGQKNSELLEAQRTWIEEMQETTPNLFNSDYSSSLADFEAMMNKQNQLTSQYYDAVKFLDDGYYEYRKSNIMTQAEEWEKAGRDEIAIAEWIAEKLKELDQEKKDSSVTATTEAVSGMTILYQQFQSSVQGMQFNFLEGWNSFTKSVLSSFKSMINQMISQLVTSGLLTLLASLANPASAGIGLFGSIFGNPFRGAEMTPIGTGEGLPFGGGFASFPTSPIGSGSATTNPNTGTIRGSDDGIINKLNEVINAINVNSIRGKITTISRIELAKEVEAGNMERSVL